VEVAVLRISVLVLSMIACAALVVPAKAQTPLTVDEARTIGPLFDVPSAKSLKCAIEQWDPVLDFSFRFLAGYAVSCRLGEFEGRRVTVMTYLRVTPEGGTSALFETGYALPEVTPEMLRLAGGDVKKVKNEIDISGLFAVGEGRYSVEVLVRDDQKRVCRKRWRLRVAAHRSERGVRLAMRPLTVEAMDQRAWEIRPPETKGGLRLTLMLDAAPAFRYQSRLQAWDRFFLEECVYSLLRQMPHTRVRVVAFNLDQQRELFRTEEFDDVAFADLSRSLEQLDTSSISVEALRLRNSPRFLIALTNRELSEPKASDAVIFVGPNTRLEATMGADLIRDRTATSPHFFYLEYFPFPIGFPDEIQHLMSATDGKTYEIRSPVQLDQAIQKMLTRLKQE
jgi:hypothetical protein